jgi:sporulation protein YlmC with PRC-barrel domain
MTCNVHFRHLKRNAAPTWLGACLLLGVGPLLAAQSTGSVPPPAPDAARAAAPAASPAAAQKCLGDLRDFDTQMQKDGYWLSGAGYGYGYPMYGYGYGMTVAPPAATASGTPTAMGYLRARPGYEVRTLLASANILAQRGEQKACEAMLTTTRDIYKGYEEDLRSRDARRTDPTGWRREQIAAAQPMSDSSSAFRTSDQLVGTDVVNQQNVELGSVNDIVMSSQTGKIAYLVISRGGVFGIDAKYVPVPWDDFKSTQGTRMLVLDSTKGNLDGAPQLPDGQFSRNGDDGEQRKNVDAYWKAHFEK